MPGAISKKNGYMKREAKEFEGVVPLTAIPNAKTEQARAVRIEYCRGAMAWRNFLYNDGRGAAMFDITELTLERPEAEGGNIPLVVHVPKGCPCVDPDTVILSCGSGPFNGEGKCEHTMGYFASMFTNTRLTPIFVTVGVRQCPGNIWPCSLVDAEFGYDALRSDAVKALIGTPSKIGLMGTSLHGITAAHLAVKLASEKKPCDFLALHTPFVDPGMTSASHKSQGHWQTLSIGYLKWVWGVFLNEGTSGTPPTEEQIKAVCLLNLPWDKLAGLKALVISASADATCDDAIALGDLMKEKGVDVTMVKSQALHPRSTDTDEASNVLVTRWYYDRFGRDHIPNARI